MKPEIIAQARHFVEAEIAFHLGFLPTEQSNPLSAQVDVDFRRATADGVRTLQRVDAEVLPMAERILNGAAFQALTAAMLATVRGGGCVVFSGCGATGRLSILLETMWRRFFTAHADQLSPAELAWADAVKSIMTGGDYALIKSVESFEDFAQYGRRQVADLEVGANDLLVAITEGGETSSVLGTLAGAAERGARCFLLFNNPAELLCERLERCRAAITNPAVTVLDLYCGPMAIAGSTRMQATTAEQLVAGSALELTLGALLPRFRRDTDYAGAFARLLTALNQPATVDSIAAVIDFEADLYRQGGKITYWADDYLLDIFTDTTERSPTFMLPPFRNNQEGHLPQSWAFVKHPHWPTDQVWEHAMHRAPRCLEWTAADYRRMDAPAKVIAEPPRINRAALLQFEIGNEAAPGRFDNPLPTAVIFTVGNGRLHVDTERFARTVRLHIGTPPPDFSGLAVAVEPEETPLRLFSHLAVKLVLNTVSTGTMVKLDRVAGNWMSWVSVSNKKLMDRGIRLVADLGGLSYFDACCRVFAAVDELNAPEWDTREKPSPVQYALRQLHRDGR